MPNWCAVDIKYFGNKDNVERLYHDWEAALKTISQLPTSKEVGL